MLRRIDWNQGREEEEEEAEGEEGQRKPPNYCHLVWQVRVKRQEEREESRRCLAVLWVRWAPVSLLPASACLLLAKVPRGER